MGVLLAGPKMGGFTQRRKGAKGFNVRIANWDERGNTSPYPPSKGEFRTGSR